MTYRTLLVDDERWARVALRQLLERHQQVDVVAEAESVAQAISLAEEHNPDLVFLDIHLSDGTGFDVAEQLPPSTRIVFATAYDEHALRAFEVNALDYLLKPVDPRHIARSLARLDALPPRGEPNDAPATSALRMEDIVCLQDAGRLKFVHVRDIVFIEASGDYSEVHLANGDASLVSQSLRRWKERLPSPFRSIFRSTLVNLHFVDEIAQRDGRWQVHLRDRDQPLPMSRRYAQALRKQLNLIL